MLETIIGIIVAVGIIGITRWCAAYFSPALVCATMLTAIAFIYVGFSLKNNPAGSVVLECLVALSFYFLALVGYTQNNKLLAVGVLLHGLWDIIHHASALVKTDVPQFWPPFCLTVDLIDGIYFYYLFKPDKAAAQGNIAYKS